MITVDMGDENNIRVRKPFECLATTYGVYVDRFALPLHSQCTVRYRLYMQHTFVRLYFVAIPLRKGRYSHRQHERKA